MKTHIEQDTEPMNPRTECDNLGCMVCFHRRYTLGDKQGDKHDYNSDNYASWEEMEAAIQKEEDPVAILPLFLYDHGGITISCGSSRFRACDSAGWDWGGVGFIFARREDVLKEFSKKRVSKKMREQVEKILLQEVETYDQYLTGDVWGYIIEDDEGEILDSSYGFFGHDYCEKEAANVVAYLKQQEIDDAVKTKIAQSAMPCCQP